ncbi:hypothetical protein ACRAWC_24505 [Leifsonia sp. L25]|uniref:hypothetical protein n=1 Tax=Leifsonia sp. L25 TaxID=3423957 RepID=UPI003D693507
MDALGASVAADADARRIALAERRPVPTVLGVLLMALRVAAGVGYIVLNLLDWQRFVGSQLAGNPSLRRPVTRSASSSGSRWGSSPPGWCCTSCSRC